MTFDAGDAFSRRRRDSPSSLLLFFIYTVYSTFLLLMFPTVLSLWCGGRSLWGSRRRLNRRMEPALTMSLSFWLILSAALNHVSSSSTVPICLSSVDPEETGYVQCRVAFEASFFKSPWEPLAQPTSFSLISLGSREISGRSDCRKPSPPRLISSSVDRRSKPMTLLSPDPACPLAHRRSSPTTTSCTVHRASYTASSGEKFKNGAFCSSTPNKTLIPCWIWALRVGMGLSPSFRSKLAFRSWGLIPLSPLSPTVYQAHISRPVSLQPYAPHPWFVPSWPTGLSHRKHVTRFEARFDKEITNHSKQSPHPNLQSENPDSSSFNLSLSEFDDWQFGVSSAKPSWFLHGNAGTRSSCLYSLLVLALEVLGKPQYNFNVMVLVIYFTGFT
ncbi:hypothetical protein DY000_02051680 [Brassica cretica]|uniref:Uncharacterized protein n=1 Tax=Brassica cretica TaxID=69181 RepID=A0ABQ7FCJ4_BRACR|nr:hypothetical protein DY000_02051680 [Brassica cretica]